MHHQLFGQHGRRLAGGFQGGGGLDPVGVQAGLALGRGLAALGPVGVVALQALQAALAAGGSRVS
jgi:hypothetical protein